MLVDDIRGWRISSNGDKCGAMGLLFGNESVDAENILKLAFGMAMAVDVNGERRLPNLVFQHVSSSNQCTDNF